MTIENLEEWLTQYETDILFPDVSGLEHFDMLLTRSRLAESRNELDAGQRERLAQADQLLIRNAAKFMQSISAVANLSDWRDAANPSPDHWWWYLDVLTSVPDYLTVGN